MSMQSWFWRKTNGDVTDNIIAVIQQQKQISTSIGNDALNIKNDIKELKKLDKIFKKVARYAFLSSEKQMDVEIKFTKKISDAQVRHPERVPELKREQYEEMAYYSHKYLKKIRKKLANMSTEEFNRIEQNISGLHQKIITEIRRLIDLDTQTEQEEKQLQKNERREEKQDNRQTAATSRLVGAHP